MDPANLPEDPTFPNRLLFAGGIRRGLVLASFWHGYSKCVTSRCAMKRTSKPASGCRRLPWCPILRRPKQKQFQSGEAGNSRWRKGVPRKAASMYKKFFGLKEKSFQRQS